MMKTEDDGPHASAGPCPGGSHAGPVQSGPDTPVGLKHLVLQLTLWRWLPSHTQKDLLVPGWSWDCF